MTPGLPLILQSCGSDVAMQVEDIAIGATVMGNANANRKTPLQTSGVTKKV